MVKTALLAFLMLAVILPDAEARRVMHSQPNGARPGIGPKLLRVSPDNPRYFSDGAGKIVYLTGSHTWNNFQDISVPGGGEAPLDFSSYLDLLARYNHNFFRLWVWEQAAWISTVRAKTIFAPMPYRRTGPGRALDGGLKFDLAQFDQGYFDRLRERVSEAQERGFYVSVMLFQGFGVEVKGPAPPDGWFVKNLKRVSAWFGVEINLAPENNPWRGHPFNPQNNVNGVNGDPRGTGDGRDVHTLEIPRITRLQEEYVEKCIDTLNDLDNVLWEIANESHGASTAWQYHMIDFIHRREGSKGREHPVLMSAQWPGGKNAILFNSPAEAISPGGENGYKDNPPVCDGKKIIISDTDHLWGVGGNYDWVWKSFLRGLNPIFMDPLETKIEEIGPEIRYDPANPEWELLRKNMGYTLRFANRVDLKRMLPRPDLASSGYCLADEGREYLIYTPREGRVAVDLSRAAGEFATEWFDPVSGASSAGGTIPGGAERLFAAPFENGAVLYIRRD